MREKLNAKSEMLVHVPLCTHAQPKLLLIISNNPTQLQQEASRYKDLSIEVCSSSEAITKLTDTKESSADVIVCDDCALGKSEVFVGLCKRALGAKGVMSMSASSLISQNSDAKKELEILGGGFRILMPYWVIDDGVEFIYLASNYYHPTADINLQRADLTSGFNYYNSDIAVGAFCLPTLVKKEFLGLIKS